MKFKGATDSEMKILETLWEAGRPMGFRELMEIVNQGAGNDWKKQTMNTFLFRMQQKKLVEAIDSGKYKHYLPLVSRDEYITAMSREFLDGIQGDFMEKMFLFLRGGERLNKEDIRELRRLLEEWEKE